MFGPIIKGVGLAASPKGRKAIKYAIILSQTPEGKRLIAQARRVAATPEGRKLVDQAVRTAAKAGKAAATSAATSENRDRLKDVVARGFRDRGR
jgi:hypothetical protein